MMLLRCRKNIAREIAVMRALFDDGEDLRAAQRRPHLGELRRQQPPEKRPDAHVGKVIPAPADRAAAGTVIAMFRVIERLLHEPGEGDGPMSADRFADVFDQCRIARGRAVLILLFGFCWKLHLSCARTRSVSFARSPSMPVTYPRRSRYVEHFEPPWYTKPKFYLPIAAVGAVLIGAVIYCHHSRLRSEWPGRDV